MEGSCVFLDARAITNLLDAGAKQNLLHATSPYRPY